MLLLTLDTVLGHQISSITGHDALFGSVPMVAVVATISGSSVGAIALIRERADGLLARLWVLPVHRASGLLSRFVAEAVRILVTTVVILCAGLMLGFRFQQGLLAGAGVADGPGDLRTGVRDARHDRRFLLGDNDSG